MKKTMKFFIGLCLCIFLLPASANAAEGIKYSNGPLGFSLTLPSSWEGLYRVRERKSNMADAVWVTFISIRNADAGYGGDVFSICISHEELGDIPGTREISRIGRKIAYSSGPSDVQFDHTNRTLSNEYNTMQNDVKTIIKTFRFVTP